MPAFHEPGPGLECIVNLDVWNDLSPHLQEAIRAATAAAADATTSDYAYHNPRVLRDMPGKGAEVAAFPDDVVKALGAASRDVIAAYPQDDAHCRAIHGSYFAFVRDCAVYGAAMEGRMLMDRAAVWGG